MSKIAEIEAMVGDTIKVFLPGESPWATITEVDCGDRLRVKARIVNKLFHEHSEHEQARFMKGNFGSVEPLPRLHDYKQGDEVWSCYGEYGFEPDAPADRGQKDE